MFSIFIFLKNQIVLTLIDDPFKKIEIVLKYLVKTKNGTRTTLAILLVGVYVLMWALIINEVFLDDDVILGEDGKPILVESNMQKLGDFVGIISTMSVLVTLVVQFYFRRSNPADKDDPKTIVQKRYAQGQITKEIYDDIIKNLEDPK